MSGKFSDLKPSSLAALMPFISYWSLGAGIDINSSINTELDIATTGFMYCANYAIFYAVLLDDKDLLEDLYRQNADLEVRNRYGHGEKTPLEVAIDYGRAGIVDSLIKHGAKLPNDCKVPSSNLCTNPFRFFWTLNEKLNHREADYKSIDRLLQKKSC